MCLEITFTLWEGFASKDGTGVFSSSFTFDDFINWPQAPIDGFLRTACIVLSSLLTMTSMIKKEISACIFCHIHNCSSLHTFRDSLKVLWSLMLLCFFYSLIHIIILLEGVWIEVHTNNSLRYTTYDEGMPVRGVISPSRWSLLTAHLICNGDFYLVFISVLIWLSTPLHILLIVVC